MSFEVSSSADFFFEFQVDWDKELEEEAEKQKKKKKDKPVPLANRKQLTDASVPPALPKPNSSPKALRTKNESTNKSSAVDLLGLSKYVKFFFLTKCAFIKFKIIIICICNFEIRFSSVWHSFEHKR